MKNPPNSEFQTLLDSEFLDRGLLNHVAHLSDYIENTDNQKQHIDACL